MQATIGNYSYCEVIKLHFCTQFPLCVLIVCQLGAVTIFMFLHRFHSFQIILYFRRMLSYFWWALRGFPEEDVNAEPSTSSETDELAAIRLDENAMEKELAACLRTLQKARYQRRLIQENYEELILSTYDELEHPIVRREVDTMGPLFNIKKGVIERIQVQVEESDNSASDYSDEEIVNALRPRGTAIVNLPSAGKPREPQFKTVIRLSDILEDDFYSSVDYCAWQDHQRLWRARAALTSEATRYELLGKIEDECEKLDERLFALRMKLATIKAKGRRAEHQLEVLAEESSHNLPATESEMVACSQTAPAQSFV